MEKEMKKGRRYIQKEPMTGRGDEVKKNKKPKKESGKTWDGISRPATDNYRENWVRIFERDDER
jgi:hypothetical protein